MGWSSQVIRLLRAPCQQYHRSKTNTPHRYFKEQRSDLPNDTCLLCCKRPLCQTNLSIKSILDSCFYYSTTNNDILKLKRKQNITCLTFNLELVMVKRKISIQDNDTSESAMEIAGMKVFKSIRTIRIEIFEILPKTSHVELFCYQCALNFEMCASLLWMPSLPFLTMPLPFKELDSTCLLFSPFCT